MKASKLMLLGEIGVGKSSLARRLVFDKFEFDYKPTIGVDVYRYDVPDVEGKGGRTLIIWDTDGNFGDAIFKHIYMREASAALIIGDISRQTSLETMAKLGKGFMEIFPGRHVGYIVNKIDLVAVPETVVLPQELTRPGSSITHTSAKTGDHVARAFETVADCIARRGG